MNPNEDQPTSDSSLVSFEDYLRRFQPTAATFDACELSRQDVCLGAAPTHTMDITPAQLTSPVLQTRTSWSVAAGAWMGGVLCGAAMMFLLLPSAQSSSERDDRERVASEAKPDQETEHSRESLVESANPTQRDLRNQNSSFVSISDQFPESFDALPLEGLFEKDSPLTWSTPRRLILRRAPNQPASNRTKPSAVELPEFHLEVNLPPPSPAISVHALTRELISESL